VRTAGILGVAIVVVALASQRGARTLPMEDLYVGYQKKAMTEDEVDRVSAALARYA
jgi:xanthine dehydrogenase iron-sulfur cluster and FAD-binding subunit A